MTLRNKLREEQSKYSFKISVLESEQNNLQTERDKLKKLHVTNDNEKHRLEHKVTILIDENESLTKKINDKVDNEFIMKEKINNLSKENDNFKEQFITYEQKLVESFQINKQLTEDRENMHNDIHYLQNLPCTIPEHNNFEVIIKQNQVLLEVIRKMRIERDENEAKVENNLKSIEESVDILKNTFMVDITNDMNANQNEICS